MSIIKKFLTSKADPGIKYYHFFWDKGDHCLGYRFPCDSEGKLLRDEHYDSWIQNYKKCISRPEDFDDAGIQVEDNEKPIRALCSCGREVVLDGNIRCGCGQWYNEYGQPIDDMTDRADTHSKGF